MHKRRAIVLGLPVECAIVKGGLVLFGRAAERAKIRRVLLVQ